MGKTLALLQGGGERGVGEGVGLRIQRHAGRKRRRLAMGKLSWINCRGFPTKFLSFKTMDVLSLMTLLYLLPRQFCFPLSRDCISSIFLGRYN